MDFAALAELCAPETAVGTLRGIASVESGLNPYAIGVVGGRLERQPRTLQEALATTRALDEQGYDYSVGIVQVNQKNFGRFGLTAKTAFDPCRNLRTGSLILQDCLKRAGGSARALDDALSCYVSGNFKTGYRLGYVARVRAATGLDADNAIMPVASSDVQKPTASAAPAPSRNSDTVFVTAAKPPVKIAAEAGGVSSTLKGRSSALLF